MKKMSKYIIIFIFLIFAEFVNCFQTVCSQCLMQCQVNSTIPNSTCIQNCNKNLNCLLPTINATIPVPQVNSSQSAAKTPNTTSISSSETSSSYKPLATFPMMSSTSCRIEFFKPFILLVLCFFIMYTKYFNN